MKHFAPQKKTNKAFHSGIKKSKCKRLNGFEFNFKLENFHRFSSRNEDIQRDTNEFVKVINFHSIVRFELKCLNFPFYKIHTKKLFETSAFLLIEFYIKKWTIFWGGFKKIEEKNDVFLRALQADSSSICILLNAYTLNT